MIFQLYYYKLFNSEIFFKILKLEYIYFRINMLNVNIFNGFFVRFEYIV